MVYDFANNIENSTREDVITVLFMDVNDFNGDIVEKFLNIPEFFKEVKDFLDKTPKEEALGSVQFVILPKIRRVIACAYVKDIWKIDKNTLEYDVEALEMCLLTLKRKIRCPIAIVAPEADTPEIGSQLSYKILDKVKEILNDKEVTVYFS